MKLTQRKIVRVTIESSRRDKLVFDDQQRGLGVRVTATGSRTYLCQYTLHGRKWRVPLGACSAISLSKARMAAAAIMGDVAKGKNPANERKEAAVVEHAKRMREHLTLRLLIDDWKCRRLANCRPRYVAEAVRALHYAFERHLNRPAEDLSRGVIVRALDALIRHSVNKDDGSSCEPRGAAIASRTAAYGAAPFAWAVKRGAVRANPFLDLPRDASIAKRERVLSEDELVAVWRTAGKSAFPFGAIVRLLILTGQRRDEVAGMTWSELTDDLALGTIPSRRTKNGEPNVVPLSLTAQEILQHLPRQDWLVLPSRCMSPFTGWSKSKAHLDRTL